MPVRFIYRAKGVHMDAISSICPEVVLQDLGHRLRQLRKYRNLRQLDMASFGLSYKYYQRLESGQVNPTLVTLHRLAAAFEVSVYDLFRPEMQQDVQA
jgi:transcriptional regulator with XRE-family HTH domain